jgi:diacylglycerol kinase (ATP)
MKNQSIYCKLICSLNGLRLLLNEKAFKMELLLIVPTGLVAIKTDVYEYKILIVFAYILVLIVEVLNTAIEGVCDFVCDSFNKKIGAVKDLGSAAVFISLLMYVYCLGWVLVYG